MTKEKVLEVVELYRKMFKLITVGKADFPEYAHVDSEVLGDALNHCNGMLDKIERFVEKDRMEKAFRWLGFIQGFLWSSKLCSIDEMREQNKPSI